MSRKLISLLVFLAVLMVSATYHRIFIKGDYIIKMEIACDSREETCLVKPPVEGDGAIHYKVIEQKAYNFK